MTKTLFFAGAIYIGLLVVFTLVTKSKEKDSKTYFLAGANLGSFLGLFTFAATLFSTFTLLGMPDFFRTHGVGAWIFLAVSDMVMVFGILAVGYYLRRKTKGQEYLGMSGFMERCYESRLAGIVAFVGAFIFLIPYVAIQIRGVAIFLVEAFENGPPLWVYALAIVVIMLIYSEIGGLKAIIYSDTLQGILLLIVIWIIGIRCLNEMGGLAGTFQKIGAQNEALLSVPGPKGLFNFQFLFSSMVAICMIPFTQPQVSTRLIIMKSEKSLFRTAIGLGTFAILVILPTVFLGMYGALNYPEASTSEFLGRTLVHDQPGFLGAFVLIGLVAAAISTADSQIFALGGETRSLLQGEDRSMVNRARISILVFAALALIFALLSSDELVLLARSSFAGTALLAPMIFTGIFYDRSRFLVSIPWVTLGAIFVMILSQLDFIGSVVGGVRVDLLLLIILSLYALLQIGIDKQRT
ncbi:MAG: sodium:solute symporter family protein [Saprospiraceae bacterium]|nr:sodium:solute symporter family protein [Saprospiraceae bacterium]